MSRTLVLCATLGVGGCAQPAPVDPPRIDWAARNAAAPAALPSCVPASAACPDQGLDPARCYDQPAAFDVKVVDGVIADVAVRVDRVGDLAPGRWWTRIPDPLGGCADAYVAWDVHEAQNVADAPGGDPPDAGPGRHHAGPPSDPPGNPADPPPFADTGGPGSGPHAGGPGGGSGDTGGAP